LCFYGVEAVRIVREKGNRYRQTIKDDCVSFHGKQEERESDFLSIISLGKIQKTRIK